MATYDRTRTVEADVDTVFDYVADVGNLPRYLEQMRSATPEGEDEIHVVAVVDLPDQGRTEVESDAWFRVDREAHRVEWGSEGPNDYHGSVDVSPGGSGSCTVTLSVHTLGHEDEPERVDGAIDDALDNIAGAVAS